MISSYGYGEDNCLAETFMVKTQMPALVGRHQELDASLGFNTWQVTGGLYHDPFFMNHLP
jgi:hypothetical protein